MTEQKTPTPRTDAEVADLEGMRERGETYTEPVSSAFAREMEAELLMQREMVVELGKKAGQLETDLQSMTSERDAANARVEEMMNDQGWQEQNIKIIKLETELTAALADIKRRDEVIDAMQSELMRLRDLAGSVDIDIIDDVLLMVAAQLKGE